MCIPSTFSSTADSSGTKIHQQTRKAISRRKPALVSAIRKFNTYCCKLKSLYNPTCGIPLPQPLPTELSKLRDRSTLMEDVWVMPSSQEVPRWLEEQKVREGIRGMLKVDRCAEEHHRLRKEADNLCRWWGREIATVELALRMPQCKADIS